MTAQVKLVRGQHYLDLTASPYAVGMDFAPPAINASYTIGTGTSANRINGGTLISRRLNNRAFEFSLRILAPNLSAATIYQRRVSAFVEAGGADPLYLEYRENTSIPVPLWGQFGAPIRYEIVTASIGAPDESYTGTQGRGFMSPVVLEVKPLAEGVRNNVLFGLGGFYPNAIGSTTGAAHGMEVAEASTNLFTNPVFGNATFTTSWTSGAGILAEFNEDTAYCLPGVYQSAKLTPIAAANRQFYAALTLPATSHTLSFLICKPDRSAIAGADVSAYFNSASQTATLESLGNGWYRGYYTGTGAAAARNYGIVANAPLFVAIMQVEATTYPTPFFYGEMLGCYWGGTRHASTSTRVQSIAQLYTANALYMGAGAISLIWRSSFAANNTLYGDREFFSQALGTFSLFFDVSTDTFNFLNAPTTLTGPTETFVRGDVVYLTATWGAAGIALYKDGVLLDSDATYTPPAWDASIYVMGTALQTATGEFLALETYDHQLTQSEVTAWYGAASAIVSSGDRPDTMPILWTATGDGIIQNHNDSGNDNFICLLDAGGSAETTPIYQIANDALGSVDDDLILSRFDSAEFINPGYFYADQGGDGDANSSGGEYMRLPMDATDTADYTVVLTGPRLISELYGREFIVWTRIRHETGSTHSFNPISGFGTYRTGKTTYPTLDTTNFTLQRAASMVFQTEFPDARRLGLVRASAFGEIGLRVTALTGTALDLDTDFINVLFRPILRVSGDFHTAGGVVISGLSAYSYSSTAVDGYTANITGDELTILPGRYNTITVLRGRADNSMLIALDIRFMVIQITPRYTLV